MITGYFRQDSDCHWYLIPDHRVGDFDRLIDEIDQAQDTDQKYDLWDRFNSEFSRYMVDGVPNSHKVIIEE